MEKNNRKPALVIMSFFTAVMLGAMAMVWVALLTDSPNNEKTAQAQRVSAEQRRSNGTAATRKEKLRKISATRTFKAMAAAIAEKMSGDYSKVKDWCQLFSMADEDSRAETIALQRLERMSGNATLDAWLKVAACARLFDNAVDREAWEMALDEIWLAIKNENLFETTKPYGYWEQIYKVTQPDSELEKIAMIGMSQTIETPNDGWLYAYN